MNQSNMKLTKKQKREIIKQLHEIIALERDNDYGVIVRGEEYKDHEIDSVLEKIKVATLGLQYIETITMINEGMPQLARWWRLEYYYDVLLKAIERCSPDNMYEDESYSEYLDFIEKATALMTEYHEDYMKNK